MPIVNFKLMDLSDFVDGEEKIKKNPDVKQIKNDEMFCSKAKREIKSAC